MNRKKYTRQFQFTVIAGDLKGRKIVAPDLGITRPPLTRLRKSIFDFLTPYLQGAHYLDLFSGTGSYLFEAVSRGVARAIGIELEARLTAAINKQAAELKVDGRLNCLKMDVFVALPELAGTNKKFDIVMIAPPQYRGLIDKTLGTIREFPLLRNDGLIVCQHDTSEAGDISFMGFPVRQQRYYGNTTFSILSPG